MKTTFLPPAKRSRISSKLQVTLPAAFVRSAGIGAGDPVSIVVEQDGAIKIFSAKAALEALAGSLSVPDRLKGLSISELKKSRSGAFARGAMKI